MSQLGERNIYRGFTEEGEGQFPIAKTRDWVEEDLHGINGKYAKHLLNIYKN